MYLLMGFFSFSQFQLDYQIAHTELQHEAALY
jgi:hypothetical protein